MGHDSKILPYKFNTFGFLIAADDFAVFVEAAEGLGEFIQIISHFMWSHLGDRLV